MNDFTQRPLTREDARLHGFVEISFRLDTTHADFLTWLTGPLRELNELKVIEHKGQGIRLLRHNLAADDYSPGRQVIFVDEHHFIVDPKTGHPLVITVLPAFEIHAVATNTKLLVNIFHHGNYLEIMVRGFAYIVSQTAFRFPELKESLTNQLQLIRSKNQELVEAIEKMIPATASPSSLKNPSNLPESDVGKRRRIVCKAALAGSKPKDIERDLGIPIGLAKADTEYLRKNEYLERPRRKHAKNAPKIG